MAEHPPDPDIIACLRDPALFGGLPQFRDLSSWRAWIVVLKAVFGLPLDEDELVIYGRHTQRPEPPADEVDEAALICGRRSGKSMIAALIAVYLALIPDWREYLAPGEAATVALVAQNTRAAVRALFAYARGIIFGVPALRREVTRETFDTLEFGRRRSAIAVWPSTHRSIRGLTLAGAVLDEVDYWWQGDSPNAAAEVIASVRPALVSLPGSKLVALSSPYTTTGWLHGFHKAHWARASSPLLVWQAPSLVMNPTLDAGRIAAQRAEDPAAGLSEWDAQWRSRTAALFDYRDLQRCVRLLLGTLPPRPGVRYVGAADPSGGGADQFAWSICHRELDADRNVRVVVDLVRARGGTERLDLDAAVRDCAADMRAYGIGAVVGDRYSGDWVAQAFARAGLRYEKAAATKSEAYLNLLPLVTQRRLELPDDGQLLAQLQLLERRAGSQGKDAVDHPVGAHDDLANAVALAAFQVVQWQPRPVYVGYTR
jgi:hypothetical protein